MSFSTSFRAAVGSRRRSSIVAQIALPLLVMIVGSVGAGVALGTERHGPEALRISATKSSIVVDGRIEEDGWADALTIDRFWEWRPGDNVEPRVRTQGLLTFDEGYLYVAMRCFDPEPGKIRAHLMDRDDRSTFVQDDHVTLIVDTFNDGRRGFQFRVNPLGIQMDALQSDVDGIEDFSWDVIWASAGRITSEGYEVELAIPLRQIRFSSRPGQQTWGIQLERSWPRNLRHRMRSHPTDRDRSCLLCQLGKVTGFEELEPGRNLELDPTLTAIQRESSEEDFEPGLSGRWGVTPAMTVSFAANPDFSQVEADAAQLDVNERFALFFPEKRPFFLEGADLFATPIDAVFSRTVVDPDWGLRLTGTHGRHALGLSVTRDTVNNIGLPGNEDSGFASSENGELDPDVFGSVLRYRRDVGAGSAVGVLYAGRESDDYHNRVAGLDSFVRLGKSNTLQLQGLASSTQYPPELADQQDVDAGGFSGTAVRARFHHASRYWWGEAEYRHFAPGFRADSGFVTQVDVRSTYASFARTFWGDPGDWYNQYQFGGWVEHVENDAGETMDRSVGATAYFLGPLQSEVWSDLKLYEQRFDGVDYDGLVAGSLSFSLQPAGAVRLGLYASGGDTVDFQNGQEADTLDLRPKAEVKLGRHINAQLSHLRRTLDVDGGRLLEANQSELSLFYHFDRRTFVRALLQRTAIDNHPALFDFPIEEWSEDTLGQLLFSYKLNPKTVILLGYSENRLQSSDHDATTADRTLFVKLGYAWLL